MYVIEANLLPDAVRSCSLGFLLELQENKFFSLAPQMMVLVIERIAVLREMSEIPTRELVTWVSPANKTLVMGTLEEYLIDIAC